MSQPSPASSTNAASQTSGPRLTPPPTNERARDWATRPGGTGLSFPFPFPPHHDDVPHDCPTRSGK